MRGASRLAIVGVGSGMRGDDAAGSAVIKTMKTRVKSKNVLLLEAGVSPESLTQKIRRFGPSHVIIIDAADFGGKPGEMAVSAPDSTSGFSFSTHSMPLSILSEYIEKGLGAKVLLIGIQPKEVRFGKRMSAEVRAAIPALAERLGDLITSCTARETRTP